jgi:polysaccharide deacetylase 2 family uncharacterized protein YibQ
MGRRIGCALLLSLVPLMAGAGESPAPPLSAVAVIIDDLGDNLRYGDRAVDLPGAVTCSFLPHTPHAVQLAEEAHRLGKEVMLHLPMESEDGQDPGPGALALNMTHEEFLRTLRDDLAAVPYAAGINNHMGSLITRHPGHMEWLMRELHRRGDLYFVDSRTTAATVAQRVAQENAVPNLRRNVFLDDDLSPAAIARQFQRLLALARRHGSAVAIGHPHPATLSFLEQHLPDLARQGIRLLPVSQVIRLQAGARRHRAPLLSTAGTVAGAATP